ncbi:hypothetical protein HYR69_01920, partial [Candidatus Sumerlaeota bacterium]|nr:hypothetical protein [Candidatus Sumerlaeota bacterium]
ALEVDSSDNDAQIQLGFDLLRLGEEKEGRKILEKSFQTEKYNVQLYNMLTLLDTLDTYQTIERGPFILKLPKKEAPIIAEDALSLLTEAYERYRKKYDVELETPIMVQIFNRHDDFMVRSIGLPGSLGYMGICFGRLVTMDSPSARSKGSMNWRAVLWHEFVHVITLQKTKNKMPRWLSEGISVYEESQFSPAWKQLMELDYKPMVSQGDLPGLSDLEPYFTTPKSPQHLVFGYFLAGEFVHFYVERYGFEALKGALARMGEVQECNVALAEACGRPLSDIDAAFKGYLRERLKPYENLPAIHVAADDAATSAMATAPAHVSDDSPYTDAIHKAEAAVAAKKWDEAEAEFKKAHEMFPDRVGPGSPLDGLVLLYESTSRREAVEQALRQQIDTDQHALPACQKLLAMLVEDQNWAEVARLADWSLGIDPFDVTIREAMLKAVRKSGDRERELTLLAQLVELDPSHTLDYRLDTIETLIALERWDPAKKMTLALLEETPHFWRAQELLLKIVEHKGGAPTYAVP